eukprot:8115208-Lingulodinium_polyedra.AAC.1
MSRPESAGTVTSSCASIRTLATRVLRNSRQPRQRVQTQSAVAEPHSTSRGGGTQCGPAFGQMAGVSSAT